MLKLKKHRRNPNPVCLALLVAISCFTNHSICTADTDIRTDAAVEYRDQGLVEQKKGNLTDALNYFIKANKLGLEDSVVLNDIAIIYEQIGLTSKAEQYYLQAVATDEKYLPPYLNLAYMYLNAGRDELAFQYFKKRFERSERGDPWGQKAKEEMLKIHPEFITWVVTQEAKRLDEELVIQAHAQFANKVSMANEHFMRAEQLKTEGKITRALTEYDQALRLTPNNPKIKAAVRELKMQQAKEEFGRRSEHAMKMLETGNTQSAREEIRNMLATIPNE